VLYSRSTLRTGWWSKLLLAVLLLIGLSAIGDGAPTIDPTTRGDTNGALAGAVSTAERVGPPHPALSQRGAATASFAASLERRSFLERGRNLVLNIFTRGVRRIFNSFLFTLPFWVALILTLTLERLLPAQPDRKTLSVGLAHDAVWFLYIPFLDLLVISTYVAALVKLYHWQFDGWTITALTAAPLWVRFVLALLLQDLCFWVQHYVNHKVPLFWRFHMVHHSQQQLNFFTDFRYHFLEYVVRGTFLTVPFLLLRIDPPVIVGFAVVRQLYTHFYHGNIRTDLGPLKYILVTPQSHRIHHSVEMKHHDKNFGAVFSFWDILFGQQYWGFDEYPETGIDHDGFPHEQKASLKSLFLTPWLQMLYPLRRSRASSAAEPEQLPTHLADRHVFDVLETESGGH
jgi:sterol desaturase/sphingolipid hydroxylase (fatty acid hydroxylase superfamily)